MQYDGPRSDIIITRKREKIVFSATSPKGEEFLQLYCMDSPMEIGTSVALNYKRRAEELGLSVELNI